MTEKSPADMRSIQSLGLFYPEIFCLKPLKSVVLEMFNELIGSTIAIKSNAMVGELEIEWFFGFVSVVVVSRQVFECDVQQKIEENYLIFCFDFLKENMINRIAHSKLQRKTR